MNALAPRIAGKFQVSTTVIKMIPLALMAVVGTVVGIGNGRMAENFASMTSGGGVAGMKLVDNDKVLTFSVVPATQLDDSVAVTITQPDPDIADASSSAKVTALDEFAPKGRNTQGLRAHRMLRGETGLALAWAGPQPLASTTGGVARALPQDYSGRDDSGIELDSAIGVIGHGGTPVAQAEQAAEGSQSAV